MSKLIWNPSLDQNEFDMAGDYIILPLKLSGFLSIEPSLRSMLIASVKWRRTDVFGIIYRSCLRASTFHVVWLYSYLEFLRVRIIFSPLAKVYFNSNEMRRSVSAIRSRGLFVTIPSINASMSSSYLTANEMTFDAFKNNLPNGEGVEFTDYILDLKQKQKHERFKKS